MTKLTNKRALRIALGLLTSACGIVLYIFVAAIHDDVMVFG